MTPPIRNFILSLALSATAFAQTSEVPWKRPAAFAGPTPFPAPAASATAAPRDTKLVEKKFEELSNQTPSLDGQKALAINAAKWKHAETDNFILHYRRVTEAQKVAREVEYDLWFIATTLGATKDRYAKKSHIYVFEDAEEWKQFLAVSSNPMKWAASYAHGDELFLNVRGGGNTGAGASFDSNTLAHETTHAVVARIFPGKRWPLWLGEGFAEYMGGASIAARKGQSAKRHQGNLTMADMPLPVLEALEGYPSSEAAIGQLYQTSEKFVRFLMSELPKDRIVKFIDAVIGGKKMREAVLEVYGDKVKDWDAFMKKYERFTK